MKKKVLLLLFILLFPTIALADTIYNIDMNIELLKDGSANIEEIWDVKADSGTEWYKQLYNLGNQKLSNFKVSMDGTELTYKTWDVDESLNRKKGYYGINYVPEGLELCFGKGDMSRHKFTLNYTLSNFIFNVSDAEVLYQTLFPNVTMGSFNVTISSYYEFPDNLDVWGYGYKGYAYVKDGKIYMSNEGSLNNDYVVLLAKFPLNTFDTTNTTSKYNTFDEVLNQAKEGTFEYDYSDYNDYNNYNNYNESPISTIFNIISGICSFIIPIGIIAGTAVVVSKNGYGYINNKTINKKEVPMFREIPCNKDIYYADALAKLNNFSYNETNIFGAIILKWIRQNKIAFINVKKGIFNKDTSAIDLRNSTFENPLEQELYDIMVKASGDGILETKELEKWARKNYSKFFGLFRRIADNKIDELKTQNHIYKRKSKEECKKTNVMDDTIYRDSVELYGLKKYLQEFSDMKHKEAIEVTLWDEYLMFAYLFGMADKVAKQFKNLYPEIVAEMDHYNMDYNTFLFINSLSANTVRAASAARSAAESYSSGGGGFSSGGGGGGSFGGGGSMGGR